MNGAKSVTATLTHRRDSINPSNGSTPGPEAGMANGKRTAVNGGGYVVDHDTKAAAAFMRWTREDVVNVTRYHRVPCLFAAGLLFFMGVEYTLLMVPADSPPFDLGFVATRPLHRLLSTSPELNTLLAALNTVRRLGNGICGRTEWTVSMRSPSIASV